VRREETENYVRRDRGHDTARRVKVRHLTPREFFDLEKRKDVFIRGVDQLPRNDEEFLAGRSEEWFETHPLESFECETGIFLDETDPSEFEEEFNNWLARDGIAPYTLDIENKKLIACGINAGTTLSSVTTDSGAPMARYYIVFTGNYMGRNLAGDGEVVCPEKILGYITSDEGYLI